MHHCNGSAKSPSIVTTGWMPSNTGPGRRASLLGACPRPVRTFGIVSLPLLFFWIGSPLSAQASGGFLLSDPQSQVYYRFAAVAGEEVKLFKESTVAGQVHSNAEVELQKDSRIDGNVSAVDRVNNEGTVTGTVTVGADPLELPSLLGEAALRAVADRVFESDTTFEDETIDDVVFVDGTLRVRGDLNGRGTLIATKDIRLDTTGPPRPFALHQDTRLSLIALNDVRIGKDRPLRGVVRAGRDVDVESDVAFEGVIVAERKVQLKKGVRLTFLDVDQVVPEVTISSPPDGSFLPTATPEIRAEYRDDLSGLRLDSVELLLDGIDRTAGAEVTATGLIFTPSQRLDEGAHSAEVAVRDHSDNEGRTSSAFVVDTVAPSLVITSPAQPVIFGDASPTIVAEYTDAVSGIDLETLNVELDGAELTGGCTVGLTQATCEPPELLAGLHTVSAAVSDRAGNAATASLEFEIVFDTEPPVITFLSPTDGATVAGSTLEVSLRVTDESEIVSVSINAQAATLSGGVYRANVALVPGPNTLIAEAVDEVGNRGSASITVRADATPPELSITAPPEGVFLADSRPAIDLAFSDDDSGVDPDSLRLSVDGSAFPVECSFDVLEARCVPLVDLPEATFELVAALRDVAGNEATAQRVLTVDTAGVEVAIDEPQDGLVTPDAEVTLSGTAGDGIVAVSVNGLPASLAGAAFSARVPLREGTQMVVALATKDNGNTGTASIEVTRDLQPPIVRITSPRQGLVALTERLTITGLVNDVVAGGALPQVLVNGREARVAGGSFLLEDLALVPGPNQIEAVATDAVGNQTRDTITVRRQQVAGTRIALVSGNGQRGVVNEPLADPLVVEATDLLGNPVAGRVVSFEVSRNSGLLRGSPADEPRRRLAVPTDGFGQASALLTMGDTAGEGNNRVRATALGAAGEVELCASARPAAPDKILMVAGDNQRGLVGHPLAQPLEAMVVDADGNPVAALPVTFEVVRGSATLDGRSSIVRLTGIDGVARAVLTLGRDPGINNNVVAATFEALAGLPASFTASGLVAGDPADTDLAGVVLDNGQEPIPAAAVRIAGTPLETTTDADGQFLLSGVPVGHLTVVIDPADSPRPETFPPLTFETVTVAGQRNTVGQPILLPAIDTDSSRVVGGSDDVTLTMPGVEGLTLRVFAGSVSFPDGSSTGRLSISQVHLDKVPMTPPNGSLFMPPAWTIQPAGVRFDPPARITIPNDGLPPGRVIDIFQFDHTLNEFIDVGKGTVSEDASIIVSDPGFGITRAGWGGCGQPQQPTTCGDGCPECNRCGPGGCEPEAICTECEPSGQVCDGTGSCVTGRSIIPQIAGTRVRIEATNRRPLSCQEVARRLGITRPLCGVGATFDLELVNNCDMADYEGAVVTERFTVSATQGCPGNPPITGTCTVGPGNTLINASGGACIDDVFACLFVDGPDGILQLWPPGFQCQITLNQEILLDGSVVGTNTFILDMQRTPDSCTGTLTNR